MEKYHVLKSPPNARKGLELDSKLVASSQKIEELENALEDSQRHRKQMERVLKFLRERAEGAKFESSHLQKELKIAQETISSLSQQCKTAKEMIGKQPKDLLQIQREKQEAQEEVRALQSQFKSLKDQILNEKQRVEVLKEQIAILNSKHSLVNASADEISHLKEEVKMSLDSKQQLELALQNAKIIIAKYENVESELAASLENKLKLEIALQNAKNALEERDQNVKFAQQHLAKKMKDASYFSDKVEEQKVQIAELQKALVESQARATVLQQSVDAQVEHEKQLHEQLKENAKTAEAQAKKWEEKYFQLHDKWQETESQLRTLKSLENRHQQVQALLGNLGSLMGTSQPQPIPAPQPSPELTVSLPSPPIPQPVRLTQETQSPLFQSRESTIRFKQNLFD